MSVAKKNARERALCTLDKIYAPTGKHLEITNYLLAPDPEVIKLVDVMCGRAFGKSTLAIFIVVYMAAKYPGCTGLFLEPDTDRMHKVFRMKWRKHVPRKYWDEIKNEKMIMFKNGSTLYYGHRDIRGNLEDRRDKNRGPDYTYVVSDEEAIKTDIIQYTNTMAAIRENNAVRFYLTISTPKIGEYKVLINSKGHKVFKGTSHDNPYLPPKFVEQLIETMSRDQVRREIYAEMIALEGRIWREADLETKWPEGNVHYGLSEFDPKRPWWLFCDVGSATGAYLVVQQVPAMLYGERLFEGNVWVAVADLCPYHDASASRSFEKLKLEFGTPVSIVGGADINTRSSTDGKTISYFAKKVWSNVRVIPCDEHVIDKQIQYDRFSYLICSSQNHRRFCVAKNFKELEPEGRRGIKQCLEEDVWPDTPTNNRQFLPKDAKIMIQHIRDAAMMGAVMVMAPPRWGFESDRTK